MTPRLAVRRGSQLEMVRNWDLLTFADAGALRSTANERFEACDSAENSITVSVGSKIASE
jgi:hypothetical protein